MCILLLWVIKCSGGVLSFENTEGGLRNGRREREMKANGYGGCMEEIHDIYSLWSTSVISDCNYDPLILLPHRRIIP